MKTRYWLVIIGVMFLVFTVGGVLFRNYKNNQLEEKTTKLVQTEMKVGIALTKAGQYHSQVDSLKSDKDKLQAVIDYQRNNPSIIVQQNDKMHIDINRLDALNSIKLFTDNVSKYDNQRERYSLHRFDKHR